MEDGHFHDNIEARINSNIANTLLSDFSNGVNSAVYLRISAEFSPSSVVQVILLCRLTKVPDFDHHIPPLVPCHCY
jgi:hypothetical protein